MEREFVAFAAAAASRRTRVAGRKFKVGYVS